MKALLIALLLAVPLSVSAGKPINDSSLQVGDLCYKSHTKRYVGGSTLTTEFQFSCAYVTEVRVQVAAPEASTMHMQFAFSDAADIAVQQPFGGVVVPAGVSYVAQTYAFDEVLSMAEYVSPAIKLFAPSSFGETGPLEFPIIVQVQVVGYDYLP